MSEKFKVRIASTINKRDIVTFNVSPEVSESGSVEYKNLTPIHMPGNIMAYGNSSSRTFTISAKLVSRTTKEATLNAFYLQLMRSWRLPYFGSSGNGVNNAQQVARERVRRQKTQLIDSNNLNDNLNSGNFNSGRNLLGSPPDVLSLSAYSDPNKNTTDNYVFNINRVPVVLTSLSNTYSSEIDYIALGNGEPFPVLMQVELTLVESHSPAEYSKFSLSDFKSGRLSNF